VPRLFAERFDQRETRQPNLRRQTTMGHTPDSGHPPGDHRRRVGGMRWRLPKRMNASVRLATEIRRVHRFAPTVAVVS
jgi:hypothetical protein